MTQTFLFTLPNSAPTDRVLEFLSNNERDVKVVPIKDANGDRTELAEELCVELAPTMVIAEEQNDEWGEGFESMGRWIGAKSILNELA